MFSLMLNDKFFGELKSVLIFSYPLQVAQQASQCDDVGLVDACEIFVRLYAQYSDKADIPSVLGEASDVILEKLEFLWKPMHNDLYVLAMVLDPHFKLNYFKKDCPLTSIRNLCSLVSYWFSRLFKKYDFGPIRAQFMDHLEGVRAFNLDCLGDIASLSAVDFWRGMDDCELKLLALRILAIKAQSACTERQLSACGWYTDGRKIGWV
mmetsp:Transcript_32920/g.53429  ORF Transcript_32920/g.53429 Transcript_32920/m.53429 type:complete len:208 (-) Transcript_32920:595-1218(-)